MYFSNVRCNRLSLNFICYDPRYGALLISAIDAVCLPLHRLSAVRKYFGQLISPPASARLFVPVHRPNGKYVFRLTADKICVKFDLL